MSIVPLSSETLHSIAMSRLRTRCQYIPGFRRTLKALFSSPSVKSSLFGIDFDNPVGLAAGMDKKGENIPNWEYLGFGWIEIGGITSHEQEGNAKPRMFRSNKDKALINRMGFNNPGSIKTAERLSIQKQKKWANIPVGVNIGKSKITPNELAHDDYSETLERLWSYCDLFVINVSSPNTPNLRELQEDSQLDRILKSCNLINRQTAQKENSPPKPILVKVSPDLTNEQILAVTDTAIKNNCSGIVATNTTTSRPNENKVMEQIGGLSGIPLQKRSTEVIHLIYKHTSGKLPIVGVGGIFDVDSAWEKIGAGASILQLYSALIFEGPSVAKTINKGLIRKLRKYGYDNLSDAVGFLHN